MVVEDFILFRSAEYLITSSLAKWKQLSFLTDAAVCLKKLHTIERDTKEEMHALTSPGYVSWFLRIQPLQINYLILLWCILLSEILEQCYQNALTRRVVRKAGLAYRIYRYRQGLKLYKYSAAALKRHLDEDVPSVDSCMQYQHYSFAGEYCNHQTKRIENFVEQEIL